MGLLRNEEKGVIEEEGWGNGRGRERRLYCLLSPSAGSLAAEPLIHLHSAT